MQILVAGPESSGTRALVRVLTTLGAGVTHHSPNYWLWDGYAPHRAKDFDHVVVIVRSGIPTAKSMVEAGHAKNEHRGKVMVLRGLLTILSNLESFSNVQIVTAEHLTHQEGALQELVESLGLVWQPDKIEPFKNANAKYYGGEYFSNHDWF